nr:MAG TPA: hypothetical protein [Bacteriophage sp.]
MPFVLTSCLYRTALPEHPPCGKNPIKISKKYHFPLDVYTRV